MSERCSEDCFWLEETDYCPIGNETCCLSCKKAADCHKVCTTVRNWRHAITREIVPVLEEVRIELTKAMMSHAPMNSGHEGKAVIKEELDELWEEIKPRLQDKSRMREEALQVAAMGIRFVIDVCEEAEYELDKD